MNTQPTITAQQTALVVGFGRQGLALARHLAPLGVRVRVTDSRSSGQLSDAINEVRDLDVDFTLGEHPLHLLDDVDVIYVSGGVPLDIPLLVAARMRGIRFSNDSALFLAQAPCPVVGITGSSGKTTTTALVGHIAQQAGRRTWVGGNIGNPLLNDVHQMAGDDLAVMELSSFQLEVMDHSPPVAGVLNITPNHLDRHGTMAAYASAKANIVRFQQPGEIAVLGWDNDNSRGFDAETDATVWGFGWRDPGDRDGAWLHDDVLVLRHGATVTPIVPRASIPLRGDHNVLNALAAIALAAAAGIAPDAMAAGIRSFAPVPHRLETVREWRGVTWINDSIATSPERAIAAIRSFGGPLVVLLGGRDKHLPWGDLAGLVHQRARHAVLFGEAAQLIQQALAGAAPANSALSITAAGAFDAAVAAAAELAQPGDTVLLAPGGTSYDAFIDFAERGERYRALVQALPD